MSGARCHDRTTQSDNRSEDIADILDIADICAPCAYTLYIKSDGQAQNNYPNIWYIQEIVVPLQ
jgi:hypothetical protein